MIYEVYVARQLVQNVKSTPLLTKEVDLLVGRYVIRERRVRQVDSDSLPPVSLGQEAKLIPFEQLKTGGITDQNRKFFPTF